MRSIAAVLLLLALPTTAQAITPQRGSDSARLPGIVDRPSPERTRPRDTVEVRVVRSDPVVAHDLRQARRSIKQRRENGQISRREARQLRREVSRVAGLARRYGQDGLSGSERRELQLHANVVRSRADAPRVAAR